MTDPDGRPITGWRRRRSTTRSVRVAERVARVLITLGGAGTIVAVTTIFVFLLGVVAPLFRSADVQALHADAGVPAAAGPGVLGDVAHLEVDENQALAWRLMADGTLEVFAVADGRVLSRRPLQPDTLPTALDVALGGRTIALGQQDGTVRIVGVEFEAAPLRAEDVPQVVAALAPGAAAPDGDVLYQRLGEQQFRRTRVRVTEQEALGGDGAAVVRLCHAVDAGRTLLTVLRADGSLRRVEARRRHNLLTDEVRTTIKTVELPLPLPAGGAPPSWLAQSDLGGAVYAIWEGGHALRIDARDGEAPYVAETVDLTPEPGVAVSAVRQMLGSTTLVVGDDQGRVRGWFLTRPDARSTVQRLTPAHDFGPRAAAVTALSPSLRSRRLAVGFADGRIELVDMTSATVLAAWWAGATSADAPVDAPVDALVLAPRNDGVLAEVGGTLRRWRVDAPHAETTLSALFLPVFYEGAGRPLHTWQSSGGTDDFEPKLGLWPLIFGTLKASLYSLFFAVPIALLAAVYTSEFLSPRARARIKPVIEVMASLPSVVLGFLAAIVIAPAIEGSVPETLTAFVTVPCALLLGARLWQLLPQAAALRLAGLPRFLGMAAAIVAGLLLAARLGPAVERALWAGDMRSWLDGQVGGAAGGWMLLTLPLAAVLCALLRGRFVAPCLRRLSADWSRGRAAGIDLVLFGVTLLVVLVIARLLADGVSATGLDARDVFLGTYVQRNAMVVGFLIGFAVIPIMYTLAEDALSAVPDHLRAASLAAGATHWQTALRVVVPTAMSGLFSAVMIGVGRVVGETMIVLMAAGNTPVLDLNLFNGFRTLSATIAVELPEAVQGGTLYRVLFFAALTLFAMTFVINTVAELVRQRFRRRAYEL
jgi:phosphate transport system permease protein